MLRCVSVPVLYIYIRMRITVFPSLRSLSLSLSIKQVFFFSFSLFFFFLIFWCFSVFLFFNFLFLASISDALMPKVRRVPPRRLAASLPLPLFLFYFFFKDLCYVLFCATPWCSTDTAHQCKDRSRQTDLYIVCAQVDAEWLISCIYTPRARSRRTPYSHTHMCVCVGSYTSIYINIFTDIV